MFAFRSMFLLPALSLLVLLAAPAEAQQRLRWKFQPEQTFQVQFQQHTETETTGGGKPTGITIDMQMLMTWQVESVDKEGTASIDQRFDRLSVTMTSGEAEPIEFDSAVGGNPSGPAAAIAAAVQPLIGAEFTVAMTARGAVRDVRLSEEAAGALESVDSSTWKQIFSPKGIAKLLGESAVVFPEEEVEAGDSWEMTSAFPSRLGTIKQTRTYSFASAEDEGDDSPLKKISMEASLEIAKDEDSKQTLMLLDQEHTGELLFDSAAGRLTRSESTQKLTTKRTYRELTIKVETTSSSTMEIDVVEPAE